MECAQQSLRDARREPLPKVPCLWCRKPMPRGRVTRQTCSDACRAAFSKFELERKRRSCGYPRGEGRIAWGVNDGNGSAVNSKRIGSALNT